MIALLEVTMTWDDDRQQAELLKEDSEALSLELCLQNAPYNLKIDHFHRRPSGRPPQLLLVYTTPNALGWCVNFYVTRHQHLGP